MARKHSIFALLLAVMLIPLALPTGANAEPVTSESGLCDPNQANAIVGTSGRDQLKGTQGDDVIIGLGGDDRIVGLGGNDVLCGGPGDDIIVGNDGDDLIDGGEGDDRLNGGDGDDEIDGGSGTDDISGGEGNDDCDDAEHSSSCEVNTNKGTGLVVSESFIDSHSSGDTIDRSMAGSPANLSTGTFVLAGQVDDTAVGVSLEVNGETANAILYDDGLDQYWAIEVNTPESGTYVFTVVATDADGNQISETIELDLITFRDDDTLYTPGYVEAELASIPDPTSYDPSSGLITYPGDLVGRITEGMVLVSDPSQVAPLGFLRKVESTRFDGAQTVVSTLTGTALDLFRQVDTDELTVEYLFPDGSDQQASVGRLDAIGPNGSEQPQALNLGLRRSVTFTDGKGGSFTVGLEGKSETIFDLDIDWCRGFFCRDGVAVNSAHIASFVTLGLSASVSATYDHDRDRPTFGPWKEVLFQAPLPKFTVGPVLFTGEIEGSVEASANLIAALESEGSLEVRVGGGYEHNGKGWYGEKTFNGDASVTGYLDFSAFAGAVTSISYQAFDIAGPFFESPVGATFSTQTGVRSTSAGYEAYATLKLDAGASLVAGVGASFLGVDLLSKLGVTKAEAEVVSFSGQIWETELGPWPLLRCGDNSEVELLGIDLSGLPPCDPDLDTEAPTVSIEAPSSGQSSIVGTTVFVEGAAADDVELASVQLRISNEAGDTWNGVGFTPEETVVEAAITPDSPTAASWSYGFTPGQVGPITIMAIAHDTVGKTGESSVEIEIVADPDNPDTSAVTREFAFSVVNGDNSSPSRWVALADGIDQANLPTDGTVALTVTAPDASVVIPYTVIDSETTREAVIQQLASYTHSRRFNDEESILNAVAELNRAGVGNQAEQVLCVHPNFFGSSFGDAEQLTSLGIDRRSFVTFGVGGYTTAEGRAIAAAPYVFGGGEAVAFTARNAITEECFGVSLDNPDGPILTSPDPGSELVGDVTFIVDGLINGDNWLISSTLEPPAFGPAPTIGTGNYPDDTVTINPAQVWSEGDVTAYVLAWRDVDTRFGTFRYQLRANSYAYTWRAQ